MSNVQIYADSHGKTRLVLNGVDISMGCLGFTLEKQGFNNAVLHLDIACELATVFGIDVEDVEKAVPNK